MKLFLTLLPFIGSALALSIHKAKADGFTPCTCQSVACVQSWPESCYCANAAKKACYDKCGGSVPDYKTCPPRDIAVRATESQPKPKPKPEPKPKPKPQSTTPPSTCECEQTFCIQSWPESCHCQNDAKKACFEKCGGEVPTYQTCPNVSPPPSAPVAVRAGPVAKCKCTEINCTKVWPAGCYCANYAKQLCYEECGGERPTIDICHEPSSPRIMAGTQGLAARKAAKHRNQVCGGNSGYGSPSPACPSGQRCIRDPFKPDSCGPACGEAGICVENKMCGGFAGFACEKKGQICVDNPTDDCDPKKGGTDCGGVCVWPQ